MAKLILSFQGHMPRSVAGNRGRHADFVSSVIRDEGLAVSWPYKENPTESSGSFLNSLTSATASDPTYIFLYG